MASSGRTFQAPKGTRDFYPAEMAVRRHLESVWRSVSINHGFEEIDGPTFEHLDLYTAKSGPGIINELFSFRRAGGDDDYALRPEFTPTLARMVAARAGELPKPIRWFCMPMFFRAERPQRGRLREFQQWNVDVIGDDSPRAEAEVIAVAVGVLERLGLTSKDITIKLSHRELIGDALRDSEVAESNLVAAMNLLDRREKLEPAQFTEQSGAVGLNLDDFNARAAKVAERINGAIAARESDSPRQAASPGSPPPSGQAIDHVLALIDHLADARILQWCEFDLSIVRGLAYYTGTVFEIHEATGKERAIAGGGRYDKLIELFGGPSMPAVGFAMGDVVIGLVLQDKGLLKPALEYLPRPDAFVIAATDGAAGHVNAIVADLRRTGMHVRYSTKSTRNVGKLLGDAAKVRARHAVILGDELKDGIVRIKNLDGGEQSDMPLSDLAVAIRRSHATTE
jgi:histidyl-tRNA synthetase